jgi:hypothetical protein
MNASLDNNSWEKSQRLGRPKCRWWFGLTLLWAIPSLVALSNLLFFIPETPLFPEWLSFAIFIVHFIIAGQAVYLRFTEPLSGIQ